jgi:hypothetical protein
MQLYASPHAPRVESFYSPDLARTPASAYRLQAHLCRAYVEVLREWWGLDELIVACFGVRTGKRLQAAENRLEHKVVELLHGMEPAELEQAAQIFCQQTLVGFIWHVLAQEIKIDYRLKDGGCTTRLGDDKHAQAASLGQGTWKLGRSHPAPAPCACTTSPPPSKPQLAEPLWAAAPELPREEESMPVEPERTVLALPTIQSLRYRVKQAQERKRLRRKRR